MSIFRYTITHKNGRFFTILSANSFFLFQSYHRHKNKHPLTFCKNGPNPALAEPRVSGPPEGRVSVCMKKPRKSRLALKARLDGGFPRIFFLSYRKDEKSVPKGKDEEFWQN